MDDSVEVCVEVQGKIETECIFVDDVNINLAKLRDLILKSFGNIINGLKIKLRCIIEDKKSVEPPLKKKKLKLM